jgi:hypothetical protein
MKDLTEQLIGVSSLIVIVTILGSTGFAADTHVIVGAKNKVAWIYKNKESKPAAPVSVDDLQVGDTIEIQVPGPAPHGFITTKKGAGGAPTPTKDLVLACGEDKASKPNAVLQETQCGAASQFGVDLNPGDKMHLEVLAAFTSDTDFFCTVHKDQMRGTLKLKK